MSERDIEVIHLALNRLVGRVEKLEGPPKTMPRCASCGGANVARGAHTPWRCVSCEATSYDGITWLRDALEDSPRGGTDQLSPPDAGPRTTVQDGGDGGVPVGWKLAPGWHVRHPEDYSECTFGEAGRRWCRNMYAYQGGDEGGLACDTHAVEMGAIVRDVTACPECGHVPPHSLACSRSEASKRVGSAHDETCATRAGTSRNCDCARTAFDKVLASAEEALGHVGEARSRPLVREGARSYEAATPEPASRQGERMSERLGRIESVVGHVNGKPLAGIADACCALEANLAAAERERDELRRENVRLGAQVDAWRISIDAMGRATEDLQAAAQIDERERCLEIVETYEPKREVPNEWSREGALARIADEIRNGTPAPKGPTE